MTQGRKGVKVFTADNVGCTELSREPVGSRACSSSNGTVQCNSVDESTSPLGGFLMAFPFISSDKP